MVSSMVRKCLIHFSVNQELWSENPRFMRKKKNKKQAALSWAVNPIRNICFHVNLSLDFLIKG
jgi:hypothetical protein